MMVSLLSSALAVVFWSSCVSACPKHQYTYNVIEIPEPMLAPLGEYIVKLLRQPRDQRKETCFDGNDKYLNWNTEDDTFDRVKMAGIFMHHYKNDPNNVFWGIDATEEKLKENCAYNLIITKEMNIRRFLVQNGTEGEVFETLSTEDELFTKISDEKAWKNVYVLHCEHYLFHISTTFAKNEISLTVVDSSESEEQHQFSLLTQIGGLIKNDCKFMDSEDASSSKTI